MFSDSGLALCRFFWVHCKGRQLQNPLWLRFQSWSLFIETRSLLLLCCCRDDAAPRWETCHRLLSVTTWGVRTALGKLETETLPSSLICLCFYDSVRKFRCFIFLCSWHKQSYDSDSVLSHWCNTVATATVLEMLCHFFKGVNLFYFFLSKS